MLVLSSHLGIIISSCHVILWWQHMSACRTQTICINHNPLPPYTIFKKEKFLLIHISHFLEWKKALCRFCHFYLCWQVTMLSTHYSYICCNNTFFPNIYFTLLHKYWLEGHFHLDSLWSMFCCDISEWLESVKLLFCVVLYCLVHMISNLLCW